MGAFYTKYRKVFLGFTIANILIVVLQLAFAWGHYLKHEWWGLGLSLFFGTINAICAVHQYLSAVIDFGLAVANFIFQDK